MPLFKKAKKISLFSLRKKTWCESFAVFSLGAALLLLLLHNNVQNLYLHFVLIIKTPRSPFKSQKKRWVVHKKILWRRRSLVKVYNSLRFITFRIHMAIHFCVSISLRISLFIAAISHHPHTTLREQTRLFNSITLFASNASCSS